MRNFGILIALILGVSVIFSQTQAKPDGSFKELQNLQTLGEQSKQLELPILLMFGAEWCEYCHVLTENVFEPMMLSGLYEEKAVLMRHVGVDESALIPDFSGKPIKKSKWAYQLNADLTPTVLFLDGNGKEVAPRIVGIPEITMFSGVLHKNLNIAYQNMGLDKRIPATPELLEQQALQSKIN